MQTAAATAPTANSGSRVLSEFMRTRQAQRQGRMSLGEPSEGRVIPFRTSPRRKTVAPDTAGLPQPAFQEVSGQRSFSAAVTDRLNSGWGKNSSGINADLDGALETLRARSRDWCTNTDIGRRYISLVQDNVVGPDAPRLQVRATLSDGKTQDEAANNAIEQAYWAWCQRGNCELTGEMDFAAVCRTAIACAARDGEFLARRVRSRNLMHGYAVQLLEVDRIKSSSVAPNAADKGNAIRLGIEHDALGRKQFIHLYSAHPSDGGSSLAPKPRAERVAASLLHHGFVVERPEQLRGYPWTAAVLQSGNQLAIYKQYALVAAKIGAAKMGFYLTDKESFSGEAPSLEEMRDATGNLVQDVEAGMLEALPPGVSFESFNPDYPHQAFGSFVLGHEHGISAGLNVAHHNLTGNMTGVNYSSARIAELSERSYWKRVQRWFIDAFVRPAFADWLETALIGGHIRLPSGAVLPPDRLGKFLAAANFQSRGWVWIDPEADVKSAVTLMANDMRSLRQIQDEAGVDLEEVLADKARLMALYKEKKIPLPAFLQPPPGQNQPQAVPA